MRISKSKIGCYLNCKRQFYYRYIRNLEGMPSKAMSKGSMVHEFHEKFWKDEMWRKMFKLKLKKGPLKNLIEMEIKRWNELSGNEEYFVPYMIEKKIKTKKLSGIVDRVEKMENGEFCVVEIKTGKYYPNHEDELYFYGYLLEENGLNGVNKGKVMYVDYGEIEEFNLYKKKAEMHELINIIIEEINNNINIIMKYPKNIGKCCYWCQYRNICR